MIKVSVMYPNRPSVQFDHDYYRHKHLPLIKSRMGAALNYYTIDKGLAGGTADAPPAYVAACHLLCDTVEAYRSSFGPYAQEISGDIRNFTDITPIILISEVAVENSAEGEAEWLDRHPGPATRPADQEPSTTIRVRSPIQFAAPLDRGPPAARP
jgi:uncharacterized protein (TIGR02118 family)